MDQIVTAGTTQEITGGVNVSVPTTNGNQRYQSATMQGYISPFDGDYRRALQMIDAFAAALRNSGQVLDVSIVSLPLDIGPDASLEGSSVVVPTEAKFSVRIILGLPDET